LIEEFGEKAIACIFLDPRYESFVKATSELQRVSLDGALWALLSVQRES
jgi:hypothetical protein